MSHSMFRDSGDPYAEGADAALAGLGDDKNPYCVEMESDMHLSWNDGWASIVYDEDE
jgi:hypothetical protein